MDFNSKWNKCLLRFVWMNSIVCGLIFDSVCLIFRPENVGFFFWLPFYLIIIVCKFQIMLRTEKYNYFFLSWSRDRIRWIKAAPLFFRKFSYGSFRLIPTPLYWSCLSRTSPPEMGVSIPWPLTPNPEPAHPIFISIWWPLFVSSIESCCVFCEKLLFWEIFWNSMNENWWFIRNI